MPGGGECAPVIDAPPGDVVVVGAPRSGTSLVAQLLASGGLDFGDHLLPPTEANPHGFLEDTRLTDLDDELLAPHVVGRGPWPVPHRRLAWLGVPADDVVIDATAAQRERMAALLDGAGHSGRVGRFGLKDPRLVWTLDVWRPLLRPGTRLVAVTRDPDEVAVSLRTMGERERDPGYYGDLEITVERGLALWEAANRRLLAHVEEGDWLVLDHGSLVTGDGGCIDALARFTGLPIDPAAVDPTLHRSRASGAAPASARHLHTALRSRAA
jgi:hypothetical protein